MAETTQKYNLGIGIGKSIKNNAVCGVPFAIAITLGFNPYWSIGFSLLTYLLKNLYEHYKK